jgi:hypothetical protein
VNLRFVRIVITARVWYAPVTLGLRPEFFPWRRFLSVCHSGEL